MVGNTASYCFDARDSSSTTLAVQGSSGWNILHRHREWRAWGQSTKKYQLLQICNWSHEGRFKGSSSKAAQLRAAEMWQWSGGDERSAFAPLCRVIRWRCRALLSLWGSASLLLSTPQVPRHSWSQIRELGYVLWWRLLRAAQLSAVDTGYSSSSAR